jgi:hypothetical protein
MNTLGSIRRPLLLSAVSLLLGACGDDASSTTFGDELTTGETGIDPSGDGDGDPSGDGDGDPTGDGDGDPTGDGDGDPTGDGDGDPTGDGDGDPTGDGDGDGDGDGECPAGQIICEDGIAKTCNGQGGYSLELICNNECSPQLGGCIACLPGTGYCDGDIAYACLPDGSGHTPQPCDSLQGVTCSENVGQCIGACAPESLGNSYIGCDYYPTITPNPLLENINIFTFAVAVANTTNSPATVTVTRGANQVTSVVVAANSVQVISLPWVTDLRTGGNNTGSSKIVVDGAYRLRSTQPVTVYQYNPLQYTASGQFSYTNDASLLLPVNTWRDEARVVSWNHWVFSGQQYSGFYTVVAAEDDTQVMLSPSTTGQWVRAGAGVAANGTGNVVLNSSDVLVVFTNPANQNGAAYSDLTGTLISATKPIQLIGGHICTNVPANIGYCDHLEESVPSLEAVGKDYFVTVPLINPPAATKARMVRIVATEPNTTIVYDPPIAAPTQLANAGDIVTINATSTDLRITSEQKIVVSEYMQGQDAGGSKGDPAMTLAVPVEQYRDSYLIHAPTNYQNSFANIVAPTGTTVTVDGAQVSTWTPIGGSGYSVARVVLSNLGDGNHDIVGNDAFSIQVYGYGQYTSYWYPGGQNLDIVPQ